MFIPTTTIKITRMMKTGEDDNGQDILEETLIGTDIPADIQPSETQIPVVIAGQTIIADQNMFCGREVDLKENDTVFDLGNRGDNKEAYKVISGNGYGIVPHLEASLMSGSKSGVVG